MPDARILSHHRLRRRTRRGYPPAGRPAPPTEIPITWLSDPIQLRLQRPLNHAEVTQLDGATARVDNAASVAAYGAFTFTALLTTAVDADATNLAHWTVTYNTARMTAPVLGISLLFRTDAEKLLVLQVGRGQRITLTGLPTEWPAAARTLVVSGISHAVSFAGHMVTWTTTPVVGLVDGIPGPWFRWGSSSWGGSDIRAF